MKKCVLGDICTKIGSGATPTGGRAAYAEEGVSLIRSQNVLDLTFSYGGLAYLNDSQADKLKSVAVQPNDVLLNITGDSVARSCMVDEKVLPARVNQHVAIVRVKKEVANPYYIMLWLVWQKKRLLLLASNGATRHALTKEMIEELPIDLPTLAEQSKIALLLSTIDRKIALNRKRIATLEAMAKEIYDYWFVQFDFPDAHGRPYKSSGGAMVYNPDLKREIPKGWEVKRIGDVLSKIPSTEKVPTVNYSDIGIIPIIDQSEKFIAGYTDNDAAALDLKSCVVFGDHSCTVKYVNFRFARGADGTQILHSNTPLIDDTQLYFTLLGMDFDEGYKRHFSALKDKLLVISSDASLTKKYMSVVDVIFAQIRALRQMSNMLVAFRDFLLPVLMNGQVKVG